MSHDCRHVLTIKDQHYLLVLAEPIKASARSCCHCQSAYILVLDQDSLEAIPLVDLGTGPSICLVGHRRVARCLLCSPPASEFSDLFSVHENGNAQQTE